MSAASFSELPPLLGPRAALRPAQAADRAAFIAAAQASVTLHSPWVTAPSDEAAFDTWIKNAGPSFHPLLLVSQDDGGLVGVYNLSQIVLGNFCSAYLGAYAFAPFAGFKLEGRSPRYLRINGEWCDHERWALTVEDWRA